MTRSAMLGGVVSFWLAITLVALNGCAAQPKAELTRLALTKAEQQARLTKDPEVIAQVGTAWLMPDRKHGMAVIEEAWKLALGPESGESIERAPLTCKVGLTRAALADPAEAAAILRQALHEVESLDPSLPSHQEYLFSYEQNERVKLLAGLAYVAVDDAVARAQRLPGGYREYALRDIGLVLAPRDWSRAQELTTTALAAGSPLAQHADNTWAKLAQARVKANPQEAIALANRKVHSATARAAVLLEAVAALLQKDRPAAERLIRQEKDASARAWAWITLARASTSKDRVASMPRAVEAMRQETPSAARNSQQVSQWSLLAVLAPSKAQAREYLAAAESAKSRPPTVRQRAVIMAAASYIEPQKAVAIYRSLITQRRAGPNRRDADVMLSTAGHLVARVDPQIVIRASRDTPQWAPLPGPARLAGVASNLIVMGDRATAATFVSAAEEALAAQKRDAKRAADHYETKVRLLEAMRFVAGGVGELGDVHKALKLAGEIRDPPTAAETYASIAYSLQRKPSPPPDACGEVGSVAHLVVICGDPNMAPPFIW